MRFNPLVIGLTLVIGIAGSILSARAFLTYHDATEAFTQAELQYVRGSFEWQDPQFDEGTAQFRIVNASDFRVTVESLTVTLNFGDEFAGTDYSPWEPITIAPGESEEITLNFTVTTNSIQDQGGTAELGFAGQLRMTFAEFEEPLAFRFRGRIGVTPYEAG